MPDTFLRSVDALEPGDHACLLYDSAELRARAVEAYLRRGIAAGDKVLFLAATDADARLGGRLSSEAAEGQVDVVVADDAYADGGFDPERTLAWFAASKSAAVDAGFRALRACGGVPAEACEDVRAVVGYERRANALFEDRRMVALCEYDRRVVVEPTLLGILDAHHAATYAVDGDERLSVEVADGSIRLAGWIDVANAGAVAPALLEAIAARREVSVDLAEVVFADVAAVRLFADAARQLAESGRRLRLLSPPPSVPRIVEILGWSGLEALELA